MGSSCGRPIDSSTLEASRKYNIKELESQSQRSSASLIDNNKKASLSTGDGDGDDDSALADRRRRMPPPLSQPLANNESTTIRTASISHQHQKSREFFLGETLPSCSEIADGSPCTLGAMVAKMEKGMGLTAYEMDQVVRISLFAPSYIASSQRSKLIHRDSTVSPPLTPLLMYPSSSHRASDAFPQHPPHHLSSPAKSVVSLHSPYSVPTLDTADAAAAVTPSQAGSYVHMLIEQSALTMGDESFNSAGGAVDYFKEDACLMRMVEDSRKICFQSWLVIRCWNSVLDREATGLETGFVKLLHRSGSNVLGAERSDLFSKFITRGKPVMDMLTKLVELGLDNAEAVYMLHELGSRHVSYGVTRQDYESYTGPFVRTVEMCARPSTVNTQVRSLLRAFWQRASAMMLEGGSQTRESQSLKLAPKGAPFAIVFTDIEGSTSLWESQPVAMETAVDNHHKLVRELIHDHNGYEVKTIGDSFMIAFKDLSDAVTMSLRLQRELLQTTAEGLEVDAKHCEASGPESVWNPSSLRVRVGVHWCTDATPKFDVVYKRYDYYGNDINMAARVQDSACGGQVMCTSATLKVLEGMAEEMQKATSLCGNLLSLTSSYEEGSQQIESSPTTTPSKACLKDVLRTSLYMANAQLKGLNAPIDLHSLYPSVLEQRVYGKRKKDVFNA